MEQSFHFQIEIAIDIALQHAYVTAIACHPQMNT